MADLKLDEFLCFSVYAASHAFTRLYKPLLDDLGLTYPQYLAMVVIGQDDGQTVGQIGARLHLESSTLTPLLKRLEAAGHVERARDKQDERQVRLHLTEAGRHLLDSARPLPSCIGQALDMELPALLSLKTEIDRLRTALERAIDTHKEPSQIV